MKNNTKEYEINIYALHRWFSHCRQTSLP